MKHALKQMQYIFAIIYETPSTVTFQLLAGGYECFFSLVILAGFYVSFYIFRQQKNNIFSLIMQNIRIMIIKFYEFSFFFLRRNEQFSRCKQISKKNQSWRILLLLVGFCCYKNVIEPVVGISFCPHPSLSSFVLRGRIQIF